MFPRLKDTVDELRVHRSAEIRGGPHPVRGDLQNIGDRVHQQPHHLLAHHRNHDYCELAVFDRRQAGLHPEVDYRQHRSQQIHDTANECGQIRDRGYRDVSTNLLYLEKLQSVFLVLQKKREELVGLLSLLRDRSLHGYSFLITHSAETKSAFL